MAWYKRTLGNMKKAINKEDWEKVRAILQQHNRYLQVESPQIEHDISKIHLNIKQYDEDMDQIARMLRSQMRGNNLKQDMLLKVESAVYQAYCFEETIKHLIKERKFMR